MLRILALTVLAAFLTAASCRTDEKDELKAAPTQVTFTVPADSALLPLDAVRNISIDFQRSVSSTAEIELRLYPPPSSSGEIRLTAGGRNVTWFDVAPEPNSRRQHLMIDGPNFLQPYIIRWFTGTPHNAEFQGDVIAPTVLGTVTQDAVVFAIDEFGGFDPLVPESFETSDIRAVSPPYRVGSPDLVADYRFGNLPPGSAYLVVAIYDSSGDGIYDPRDDWWGYFKGANISAPEVVIAKTLSFEDPPRGDVDITLRSPFGR